MLMAGHLCVADGGCLGWGGEEEREKKKGGKERYLLAVERVQFLLM